jgi:hypothetical protein
MLSRAAAVFAAAVSFGCAPSVREFATVDEARAAGAFEQRWLPDVLPRSTVLIRLRAGAQDGEVDGQFQFSSQDYPLLAAQLLELEGETGDAATDAFICRNASRGYAAFVLRRDERVWVFSCAENKGRCYFRGESAVSG